MPWLWRAYTRHREAYGNARADIDSRFNMQRAAMQFDQILGNGKTQTRALVFARIVACRLFERMGDAFQFIRRNADARVVHFQRQVIFALDTFDADIAARFSEFRRWTED